MACMKVVLVLRVIVLTVVYCGLCLLPYGCRTWVYPYVVRVLTAKLASCWAKPLARSCPWLW